LMLPLGKRQPKAKRCDCQISGSWIDSIGTNWNQVDANN
jgi:hypothetical protein